LDHDNPIRLPGSLEHVGCATTDEVPPAERGDGRTRELLVLLVRDRVSDLDVADDIRLGHVGYSCFRATATSSAGLDGANIGISNVRLSMSPVNANGGS